MRVLHKIARALGLSVRKRRRRTNSYYRTQSAMRRVLSRPGKIDMSGLASETLLEIITDETATVRTAAAVRELYRRLKLDAPVDPEKINVERTRQLIKAYLGRWQRPVRVQKLARMTPRGQVKKAASLSKKFVARKGEAASIWVAPGE